MTKARVIGNAIVALYKSKRYSEEFSYFVIKAILNLFAHQDENFSLTAIYCSGILQSKQLLPSLVKVIKSDKTTKTLQVSTQLFIILATSYSFFRWSTILLSNEGNLYVRIFSLLGFLICGVWILLGILFPLLMKNGKNYLYSMMSIDFFFSLVVGMLIFVKEDLLAGCIFMFHGFGFLAILSAFIYQLQKYNNFK